MWKTLRDRYRSALRYKLLVLVLLPLSLAMAAALGYTLYWLNGYTLESLFFSAHDDLAVARGALRQIGGDYQIPLQQLAQSPQFRQALRKSDGAAVKRMLRQVRDDRGFAFLHLTGVAGDWLYEPAGGAGRSSKPSPLTDRAARGIADVALEVFTEEDLGRENAGLVSQAPVAPPGSAPGTPAVQRQALMLRVAQPLTDDQGRVRMVLDGAVMLNHNTTLLDAIRARVFANGGLPAGAEPLVTLILGDVRIAGSTADVVAPEGERVSLRTNMHTQDSSGIWTRSDRLGGDEFISGYGPLYDVNGQHIGALHVGFREGAFRAAHYQAAALLLALFLAATALAAWIAVRGVRTIFGPIERMTAVVRATQAGEDRRIGPVGAHDEIGELARQFDAMLDLLQQRNREIQRAAQALEVKVAARTWELARKNDELLATVSQLAQTREQLVFAERLSALGQMATGVAHEINNPAAVILGNLEVLTTELGEGARPVAREIELIAQQVERIRHIVTSLLQFARAAPAERPVEDADINIVVRDVLPLVAHVLKGKSIRLSTRLAARGIVGINVFDLEQVLINLIVNAANAVSEDGSIEIATMDAENGGATISVRDNGPGIAPEQLKRIFDPFFTTDPRHGIGLGLSVSYGLVSRYGGHITVESRLGQGSVFRVTLLRRPVSMNQAVPAADDGRVSTATASDTEAIYG
ncbi:MAG TPA: ATP-binding protein [Candidatus Methylomirabilis sp.]|nr:ATP-binding protein [Candidatus Methylomirabilis sp.]